MATFFMFGSYSLDAMGKISPERTEKAGAVIEKSGGKLKSAYALLGKHDLILIVDFPGTEQAMQASVGLARTLGISFTTSPAVPVDEFDKIAAKA